MKFELSEQDFQLLLIAMGMAVAGAIRNNEPRMAYDFLRLANAINKDNPNWKPYELPEKP